MKALVYIGEDDDGEQVYVNPIHVLGIVGDEKNMRTYVRLPDDVCFSIDRAPFDVKRSINEEI